MPEAERGRWRDLVERRLPEAARPDWPVRLDHCFARILLDNTCGAPWRETVAAPAWANLSPDQLACAIGLGEAVLAGQADLAALNRRSLALRGKLRAPAQTALPERLGDGDCVLRHAVRYGLVCHDTWDAIPPTPALEARAPEYDADGVMIDPGEFGRPADPGRAAGDRFGFRVDQLLLFLARGFDARLGALEARTP